MTLTSVPVSGQAEAWRRDQYGRYLIVPPDGGKPVGYSRVTTIAKTLDGGAALAPWKATMAATGIIMQRGLRARWEALLAEHGDPWYDGEASKAECKTLVEECASVGGANNAKEIGSALHTMTALIDVGRPPKHLTPETEADLDAYVHGMKAAGVQVVPGAIEQTVVLDAYQVAGTFDRLVTVPGWDLPLIADIKTGGNLEYSWQSIAVQLAGYSRGDAIYVQGDAKDGTQDQRLPMPAVEQEFAVVIYLPQSKGKLELWLVDITKGWEAFGVSMWARDWRKYAPAAQFTSTPQPANPGNTAPLLAQSVVQAKADVPESVQALDALDEVLADANKRTEPWLLREWLQGRIDAIGQHSEARKDLAASWPDNVPSLRAAPNHDEQTLELIEAMLVAIEARYGLPFPEPRPGFEEQEQAAMARVLDIFPGAEKQPTNTPTNEKGKQ